MGKVDIKTIHTEITKDLSEYISNKVNKLDSYIPRYARKTARANVRLAETKINNKRQYTAEVTLHLPGGTIEAKETTVNMYAAIDMVEDKLKVQLGKYKATRSPKNGRRENQIRQLLGKIIRKK